MAAFDQQLIIAAPPEFIIASIAANLPAGAQLQTIKENALYLFYRDEVGYVYFLREQPDGKTQFRFLTDSRVFVEQYFREPTLRAAMLKLTAAIPAMPLPPARLAAYSTHMSRIQKQAESGNIPPPMTVPTSSEPTTPPAYQSFESVGEVVGNSGSKPLIDPSQPLKQSKAPSSTSPVEIILIALIAILIVGGVVYGISRVANTLSSAFTLPGYSSSLSSTPAATLSPTTYEDSYIKVTINPPWVRQDASELPTCRFDTFAVVRFTCHVLVSLNGNRDQMLAVVGGVDLPNYLSSTDLPLTEVESMSWEEIKKQSTTSLYKRLEVTAITLDGGKDAIRRYYRFPIDGQTEPGYGMQIYFYHKGRIFEITADAVSEEVFRKNRPELTKFTTGIKFK